MCSPIPGPTVCCICWESIDPDEHAVDENGDLWDVHAGRCAARAGITPP